MNKMTLKKAKEIVRKKARKEFPEIPKSYWYFNIIEWEDGDFQLEYIHNFRYDSAKNANPEARGRITIDFRRKINKRKKKIK